MCLGLVIFEKRVITLLNIFFKEILFKIDIDLTLRLRLRGPDFLEENVKTFENALATFQRRLHFKTQRLFTIALTWGFSGFSFSIYSLNHFLLLHEKTGLSHFENTKPCLYKVILITQKLKKHMNTKSYSKTIGR